MNDAGCGLNFYYMCEVASVIACSAGWTLNNNKCYYMSSSTATFSTAQSTCRSLGGYVVVPSYDGEMTFIYNKYMAYALLLLIIAIC